MDKQELKIAMVQLLVEGGEPRRNLDRAVEMVEAAAADGCELVLLPETLDLGWTHPSAKSEAEPIPGPFSDILCKAALSHGIYICAGLTEKTDSNVYNSAVLIDDKGDIILKHRKINILTVAQDYYAIGNRLEIAETPWGKIGISICADNYRDSLEIGHVLARMGAQIILSPSAWTSDFNTVEEDDPYGTKWHGPYAHLASLFNIVVIGCTSVGYLVGGPYEGKKMVGCSIVVNSDGILTQGKYNEFASDIVTSLVKIPAREEQGTAIGEMLQRKGYYTKND
jgi:predicted amidohydrolase